VEGVHEFRICVIMTFVSYSYS